MRSYTKRNIKKPPSKRRTRRVQRGGTVEYDEKFVRLYYFPLSIKTTLLRTPGLIEDIDIFAAGNAPPVIACWLDASNPYGNGTRPTMGGTFGLWTDLSPFKRRVAGINTLVEYGDVGPFIGSISSGTNILTIESFTTSNNTYNKAVIAFKRVITATGIPAGTFIKGQQSIATSANGVPGKEGVYLLNNTATANITSATFGYETTTGYKTAIATENIGGTAVFKPTMYPSATFGQFGVPSVSVSGSHMISSFPRSKNYTTFMVLCLEGLRNAGTLFMHSGTTNTDNTKMIHSKLTGTTTSICINTQGLTSSNVNTVSSFTANTLNYFLVSMTGTSAGITTIRIFNSSGNELYMTSQTANAVVPDVTDTNHSPLFIGRTNSFYVSNVQPNVFTGNMHEFIYVQGAILEEDRNLIEAYLVRKWGTIYNSAGTGLLGKPIQLNANHPYNWYGGNFGVDLDTGYSAWYRVTSGATASGQIASAATASAPIGYANILKGLDIPNGRFIFKFGATREKIIVSISPGLVIPDGVFNYTTPVRYIRIRPPAVDGTGTISLSQIFVRNQNGTEMVSLNPFFLPNKIIYASGTFSGRSPTTLIDGITTARADGPKIWKNNGSRNDFVEIDLGSLVVITEVEILGVNTSASTAFNTVLDPNLKNMRLELNTTTDATDIINDIITASTARASAAIASGQIASAAIASVPVASGQIASAAIASAATASGQRASAAIASGQIASAAIASAATASGQRASAAIASGQIASTAIASAAEVSGQQASAAYASGQQASAAYASGQQASAAYASGQQASAAEVSGQQASAAYASGQQASAAYASGQKASAANASGQQASAAEVSGQQASTAYASGQQASTAYASGQQASAAYASGQQASAAEVSGQQASTAYASGQQVSAAYASGQQASAAYASGQQASTQMASAAQASTAYASGQQVSAAYASGQQASTANASGQQASTQMASAAQASAAYASGQQASTAYASGQQASAAYASGQQASVQMASAAQASAANASGQQASAAYASGQQASTANASGQQASVQMASAAQASAANASGQQVSAAYASGQQASTANASGQQASVQMASAAQASAAYASGQQASAAYASGQQASAAYASGQQASTQMASAAQASAAYASGQQASAAYASAQMASAAQVSAAYASRQIASNAIASNALGLKWLGHDPPIGKFIIRPIRP
jgi:hypothetical protein